MYANSPSHIDTICVHNHSFICNNRMIIHSISSINKYKYSCICNMNCDRVELISNVNSRIHEQPLATISTITCFKYMFTSTGFYLRFTETGSRRLTKQTSYGVCNRDRTERISIKDSLQASSTEKQGSRIYSQKRYHAHI